MRLHVRWLTEVVLLLSVSACSFMLPDKQKEYRYSTDIPPLEIPPDLTASAIEGANRKNATSDNPGSSRYSPHVQSVQNYASASQDNIESPASLIDGDDKSTAHIDLEFNYAEAWNLVGKALGRMEVEISDQDRSKGLYYVYFKPGANPEAHSGLLSDIKGWLGSSAEEAKEKEYRIHLFEENGASKIYVLDADNEPQGKGAGYAMLTRLHETIKSFDKVESDNVTTQQNNESPGSGDWKPEILK